MVRILVPVAILKRQSISNGLINLLGTVDVTVLGYHVIPEQTEPEQARRQYEDRAVDALRDIVEEFRQAGGKADYRLVFTHSRKKTIQRVADETSSQAFVIPGPTGPIDRLLVALTGDVAVEQILSFVVELIGGRDIEVMLLIVTDGESDGAQERLDTAVDVLTEHGIEGHQTLATDTSPVKGLIEAVTDYDAVVMGERAPSLRSLLFGDETARVASQTVRPVLVVRRQTTAN